MTSTPGVSLVTGSARGLGLAVARRLLERGDRVHVVYRTPTGAIAELEREFPERVHRADLTNEAAWAKLVAEIVERDGGLDHLVHAVGEYVTGSLETTTLADVERMWRSNVETAFLALQATRPLLRSRRGDALFFGCAGLEGFRARRRTAAYTAAKSALWLLVKSWAVEEAPHGVRVNLISPGHVPHEHAAEDTRDERLWERIPFGRPGTLDELARAAAWLASSEASYVTGTNLEVAGGWFA